MKAYQAALSAGNYNFQFYVGEKPMNFQGIPVQMCPGLNDFDCVLGLKSDLHFGTGLLSDTNEVKLIDMSDIDGITKRSCNYALYWWYHCNQPNATSSS
jgi:hypothetical protein